MGERLKYGFYMALVKPLSWLPLWMLYGVSDVLRFVISNCMHYRRKVIRDNLSSCYPEKSRKELRQIEREFYKQFCDNIVETIKLLNISDRTMRRRLEVRDAALVEQAADEGKPVILYLGHYCNWEWVPAITLYYDRPKVSAQLYKPLHDRAFDKLMLKVRSRFGSVSIDKTALSARCSASNATWARSSPALSPTTARAGRRRIITPCSCATAHGSIPAARR